MKLCSHVAFIFFYLFPLLSSGATLTTINVKKNGERYILHVEAQVNANINTVKRIITDYNNLTSINPYMKESKVISRTDDNRSTVRTLTKACLLFVCYKVKHVQTFQVLENNIIFGRTIPHLSDFKYGWTRWIIKEEKTGAKNTVTRLIIDTEMTPDFFILPIIGTHHLKKKIIEIATVTINNLEKEVQK